MTSISNLHALFIQLAFFPLSSYIFPERGREQEISVKKCLITTIMIAILASGAMAQEDSTWTVRLKYREEAGPQNVFLPRRELARPRVGLARH